MQASEGQRRQLEGQLHELQKKLEDEKQQRSKQARVIEKHEERWKALKEAARKKKQSQLQQQQAGVVGLGKPTVPLKMRSKKQQHSLHRGRRNDSQSHPLP